MIKILIHNNYEAKSVFIWLHVVILLIDNATLQPHPEASFSIDNNRTWKALKLGSRGTLLKSIWYLWREPSLGVNKFSGGTLIWWIPPFVTNDSTLKSDPGFMDKKFLSAWIKAMWLFVPPPSHIYRHMHMSRKINCGEKSGLI